MKNRDERVSFILIALAVLAVVAWVWQLPPRELRNPQIRDDATDVTPDGARYVLPANPDTYVWVRAARNLLTTGDPCDARDNGVCRDTKVLGPGGIEWIYAQNLHVYAIAWFARIAQLVHGPISLTVAAAGAALVVVLIGTLAAFAWGWRQAGEAGAIAAALLPALQPWFLFRSVDGDNDCWQFTLPMLSALGLAESFRARSPRGSALAAAGAGFAMALLAWTWSGWIFFDGIWLAALVLASAVEIARDRSAARRCMIRIVVYFTVSTGGAFLLGGDYAFSALPSTAPVSALHWPNVFGTVAELLPTRPSELAGSVGGWTCLALAAIGIVAALAKGLWKRRELGAVILVGLWLGAAFFVGTGGVRFLQVAGPPVALGWACLAGVVAETLHRRYAAAAALTVAVAALQFPVVRSGAATTEEYTLRTDRALWDSLLTLRSTAAPDAIVHIWWDFGYMAKYLAERRVSADGGTLRTHAVYWQSRALLAPESESIGTLRMLGCGADALPLPEGNSGALGLAIQAVHDEVRGYTLLRNLLLMDRSSARAELSGRGVDDARAGRLLAATHCKPPETWVVVSTSQAAMPFWANFGGYYVETGASPPPLSFPHIDGFPCVSGTQGLKCESLDKQLGVSVPLAGPANVRNDAANTVPELVVDVDEKGIRHETVTPNRTRMAAVIDRRQMLAWIMPPDLARSTFVALMFLNASGTESFEPGIWRTSLRPTFGEKVAAFRVRWRAD